jgi:IS30 family transposase
MSYGHITSFERGQIELLLSQGKSNIHIADVLGRALSTIHREIARNSTKDGYRAQVAQTRYKRRRKACRPKRRLDHKPLREYVISRSRDSEFTPELVAGCLKRDYPDDPRMRLCHETLYQAIYNNTHNLHYLIEYLPQRRPKRRRRGQGKSRRGPRIPNRVSITQRPAAVEDRKEIGHWEGDTIFGKNQDGFIVTLVERHSRLLRAQKTETKRAPEVRQAVIDALQDRPVSWVKTITFDNGTEFFQHELMAQELGVLVYFAQPYSAFQRGTNEQTNGLIRRYLPKGTSFKDLTQERLDHIVEEINNRPRKCLGYRTPNEVFQEQRRKHLIALGS